MLIDGLPLPDHWLQLGVEGSLAIAMLWVVLNFVLKYTAIRKDAVQPTGQQDGASTNGKSGERSVAFWEQSIGKMIEATIDKDVVPKLDSMNAELRAILARLNETAPLRRR